MSLTVQKEVLKAENIAAQHGTRVVIEKKAGIVKRGCSGQNSSIYGRSAKSSSEAGNGFVTVTGLLEMEALYSEINPEGQMSFRWPGGRRQVEQPFHSKPRGAPGAASGGLIQTWG